MPRPFWPYFGAVRKRSLRPDEEANKLAARQWGVISRRQALDIGLTGKQIDDRVRSKRWRVAVRGVYVMAGVPDAWEQHVMVACLAGPDGTAASHLTAAALLGLHNPPPVPHVTVSKSASGRFGNALVHRSRTPLDPRDLRYMGPLRCTTPARTLVDCAEILDYGGLCELLDTALCRELADPAAVHGALSRAARARGRKGTGLIERALEVWESGPRPGSPAEMRLLRLLLRWGFPTPERQIAVRDGRGRIVGRVDLGWSALKVGFEYDGAEFHGPRRVEHDVRRQKSIEALGWRLERVRKADVRPPATELRRRVDALFQGRQAA
ncbi:MAG: type IV toxin-antitoxin system AbiEi family antitoxin domain-containing protein [Acidimicrobiia bacterium]